MSIYERVLQTVLLYASDIENGDDQAIKLAILVLNKMLQCWGMGVVKADALCEERGPWFFLAIYAGARLAHLF